MSASEPWDFPIKGMTIRPDSCDGFESARGWPGFLGCVYFAAGKKEMRASFKADTGMDLDLFLRATPFERMIDEATGAHAAVAAKFADWVAVNVWGVEGKG